MITIKSLLIFIMSYYNDSSVCLMYAQVLMAILQYEHIIN